MITNFKNNSEIMKRRKSKQENVEKRERRKDADRNVCIRACIICEREREDVTR